MPSKAFNARSLSSCPEFPPPPDPFAAFCIPGFGVELRLIEDLVPVELAELAEDGEGPGWEKRTEA
jgi:hypothetical protein